MSELIILPTISPEALDKARKEISKYVSNNVWNDRIMFNNEVGTNYQKTTYERKSLKRIEVKKSNFSECKFIRCAVIGSNFSSTNFNNCSFEDSNFQFSNFSSSVFEKTNNSEQLDIVGCSFGNSNFSGAKLKNLTIQGSSFTQSVFFNSEIIACKIRSCSLEGASFDGARLQNMILTNLNVEYADFTGATFNNVYLPLMQLPYTFGGLDYFFHKEGLKLRTKTNGVYRDVPPTEFKQVLSHLNIYYQNEQQYFPLANIYLFSQEKERFDETIMLGVKMACLNRNLRDLKHLVKLVKLSDWYNEIQLRSLYFMILKFSQLNVKDQIYLQEIKAHLGEIHSLLMPQNTEEIIVRFVVDSENKDSSLEATNSIVNYLTESLEKSKRTTWTNVDIVKTNPLDVVVSFISESPELTVAGLSLIAQIFFGVLQVKKDKSKKPNTVPTAIDTREVSTTYIYTTSSNTSTTITNNNQITIINPTIIYQGSPFNSQVEVDNYIKKCSLEN